MKKLFLLSLIAALSLCFVQNSRSGANINSSFIAASGEKFTKENFEISLKQLYDQINLGASGLNYEVFRLGMIGYYQLRHEQTLNKRNIISLVDFTKASTEKRFYTIDLDNQKLLFHTYVAHGRNTGENWAKSFSNKQHSNQSSLGFYVTAETYVGSKGYSLRLDGKEEEYNGNIRDRAVVMHEADYVSEQWIKKYGRLGRSQGCPALPKGISKEVIDTIKDKTVIFAYYADTDYLKTSKYLDLQRLMTNFEKTNSTAAIQTASVLAVQ